jgi:hypothetical protein
LSSSIQVATVEDSGLNVTLGLSPDFVVKAADVPAGGPASSQIKGHLAVEITGPGGYSNSVNLSGQVNDKLEAAKDGTANDGFDDWKYIQPDSALSANGEYTAKIYFSGGAIPNAGTVSLGMVIGDKLITWTVADQGYSEFELTFDKA